MNKLSQDFFPDGNVGEINIYNYTVKNNIIVDNRTFNYFFAKRLIDLCIAIPLLIIAMPIMLIIAVAIRLNSPGRAVFKHRRIGLGAREFECLKFRTMHIDAEELLNELLKTNPAAAAEWEKEQKLRDDPRVTKLGKILRKLSLDELPQLWNIIKGEMSLVGPRPIVQNEIIKYGNMYAAYASVPPGLTGLWQVSGRNDTNYDQRVKLDAEYAYSHTIGMDMKILLMTIPVVLRARGAY